MIKNNMRIMKCFTTLSGILLGIGPLMLFKVCDSSEKIMKCTYTSRIELLFGIMLVFSSLLELLSKKTTWKYPVMNLVLWINSVLVPAIVIGGCAKKEMRCQMITFPCIYLIAAINIIINIISIIKIYKSSRE